MKEDGIEKPSTLLPMFDTQEESRLLTQRATENWAL